MRKRQVSFAPTNGHGRPKLSGLLSALTGETGARATRFPQLKIRTKYVVVELGSRVIVLHAADHVLLGIRKAARR
jgi:hypothetical protein